MFKKIQLISIFALMAILTISTMGQANRLGDLVNARASSGENQLESRGYHLTHVSKGFNQFWGYWWNPRSKSCVQVVTNDGRFRAIKDTNPRDCYQKEVVKKNDNTKRNAAIGIGVVAAGIIGAIALSHKSHHHEKNGGNHHNDANKEAEYERGYRDGLHNGNYHNYSNTNDYKYGYQAGVKQRRLELSHSTGYGGYRPHVNISDLSGIRASSGESALNSRGFRNVDGFRSGNTRYTIWYNRRTRQCVQVATKNGRFDSIVSTRASDCNQNESSGNNDNNWSIEGVTVYEGRNSRGRSQSYKIGRYLNNARQLGNLRNNRASSVNVRRGFRVRLCDSEGGRNGLGSGRCEEYGEGTHNLRYNDSASYVEVRRDGGFN